MTIHIEISLKHSVRTCAHLSVPGLGAAMCVISMVTHSLVENQFYQLLFFDFMISP